MIQKRNIQLGKIATRPARAPLRLGGDPTGGTLEFERTKPRKKTKPKKPRGKS